MSRDIFDDDRLIPSEAPKADLIIAPFGVGNGSEFGGRESPNKIQPHVQQIPEQHPRMNIKDMMPIELFL